MKISKLSLLILILFFFIIGNINFHKGSFPANLIIFIDNFHSKLIKKEKINLKSMTECYLERKTSNSLGQTIEINKKNFNKFYENIRLKFLIKDCPYVYEYNLGSDNLSQVYLGSSLSPNGIGKNFSSKINSDYLIISDTDYGYLNNNKINFIKDNKVTKKRKKKIINHIHFNKGKYFTTVRDFELRALNRVRYNNYWNCNIKFTANDKIEILNQELKVIYSASVLDLIQKINFGFRTCRWNPIKIKEFYPDQNNEFALISSATLSRVFLFDINKKKIINFYNVNQPHSLRFLDENRFIVIDNVNGTSQSVAPSPINLKSEYGRTRIMIINIKNKKEELIFQGNKKFKFDNIDKVKIDIESKNIFRITEKNKIFILDCRNKLSNMMKKYENCEIYDLINSPKSSFRFIDSMIF